MGSVLSLSGRRIRMIYAACLLVATCTHALPLIQHGLSWDYGGVSRFSAVFWTTLAFADPLAASCLFARPRLGVALTIAIIDLDVAHNAVVFWEALVHPTVQHLWTYEAFALQVAFLVFVAATARIAWREAKA